MDATTALRLTADGWRRLHDELLTLSEERREIEAAELAPDERRAALVPLESRIIELEAMLARAVPVDPAEREPGTAGVGSQVSVSWDDGTEETYAIVGPPEVETRSGRISYESPVGRALVGRKAGERIAVATPAGVTRLRVLAIADLSPGGDGPNAAD